MASKKLWLKMLSIVLTFCFVLTGCLDANSISNNSGQNDNDNDNGWLQGGIVRSAKLYDSKNTFLGYCTFNRDDEITVISPKDYLYQMYWTSELFAYKDIFFTGTDGSGDAYLGDNPRYIGYNKAVFPYKGALYTYANLDDHGVPVFENTPPNFLSYAYNGDLHDIVNFDYVRHKAYRLNIVSKSDAGVPETIMLPFKFTFE
jgi:hypothetical protein